MLLKMKNKINNFLSYFFQKGTISTIIVEYKELDNITNFLSYLKRQCVVIREDEEQKIKDILVNCKNQNVFISVPINEWIFKFDDNEIILKKSRYLTSLMRTFRDIIVKNNLSLILVSVPYNTFNGILSNVPSGVIFNNDNDYVVYFKNNEFEVVKCRWVGLFGNEKIALDNLKPILNKEFRDKKLQRILK